VWKELTHPSDRFNKNGTENSRGILLAVLPVPVFYTGISASIPVLDDTATLGPGYIPVYVAHAVPQREKKHTLCVEGFFFLLRGVVRGSCMCSARQQLVGSCGLWQ